MECFSTRSRICRIGCPSESTTLSPGNIDSLLRNILLPTHHELIVVTIHKRSGIHTHRQARSNQSERDESAREGRERHERSKTKRREGRLQEKAEFVTKRCTGYRNRICCRTGCCCHCSLPDRVRLSLFASSLLFSAVEASKITWTSEP